jgi:hypothetical protein
VLCETKFLPLSKWDACLHSAVWHEIIDWGLVCAGKNNISTPYRDPAAFFFFFFQFLQR